MRIIFFFLVVIVSQYAKAECISYSVMIKDNELCYKIILDEKSYGGMKRSVDVVLSRRASKNELETIARKIKSSDLRNKNVFIGYYKDHKYHEYNGYWATTYYAPELDVQILGMSREKIDRILKKPIDGEVIGSWLVDKEGLGWRTSLVIRDGRIYSAITFSDDSPSSYSELKKIKIGNEIRYVPISERNNLYFTDYLVINEYGDLEMRYNEDADFDMSYVARKI